MKIYTKETWGWTSYRKTGWVTDDGYKAYNGYFLIERFLSRTTARIHFYTMHPTKAMRYIVNQVNNGVDIASFEGQTIKA